MSRNRCPHDFQLEISVTHKRIGELSEGKRSPPGGEAMLFAGAPGLGQTFPKRNSSACGDYCAKGVPFARAFSTLGCISLARCDLGILQIARKRGTAQEGPKERPRPLNATVASGSLGFRFQLSIPSVHLCNVDPGVVCLLIRGCSPAKVMNPTKTRD